MSIRQGERAEQFVAREYDLDHTPEAEWYDCINPRTGTKYEVKSTSDMIGDEYPEEGRFRLWEEQHRSLTAAEGQNAAWYVFLVDGGDMRRVKPSTVTQWVNSRGGWNRAGHTRRDGKQHKLPVSEVF